MKKLEKLFYTIRLLLNAEGAKGKRSLVLCRFIMLQIRFLFQKEFIHRWVNNTKLYVTQYRHSSTLCYYFGLFDPEEMSLIKDNLRSDDIFVDVGANIGAYSIFAASYGAETYSFEPVESTFRMLERNITQNPKISYRIHPVMKVISDKEGEVAFTTNCDTSNKIVEDDNKNIVGKEIKLIPTITLDSAVSKANILKIDVEGFEKSVLGGGAKNFLNHQICA